MKKFRMDNVIDNYHGTKIADPFRWLENPESQDTIDFIDSQLTQTREFLDNNSNRAEIKDRITELWNYEKFGAPFKKGDFYYFQYNDGMKNQPLLYRSKDLDIHPSKAELVIDPNEFSSDGTKALSLFTISPNGKYMSYCVSESGSDWVTIKIMDLATKELLPETIKWSKFTPLPWLPDSSGFMYSRYPDPATVAPEDSSRFNKVYLHKLNTEQPNDTLVIEDLNDKNKSFRPHISNDGEFLLMYVSKGSASGNMVYCKRLNEDGEIQPLINVDETNAYFLGNDDNILYFMTNINAPRYKIMAVDYNNPQPENWRDIVAEGLDVINNAIMVKGHFVTANLHDAYYQIIIYNKLGQLIKRLDLPTLGAITALSGKEDSNIFYFSFSSYLYPNTIFRVDVDNPVVKVQWKPKMNFDFDSYETYQVFYESKDGTKVPMFISHKKGIVKDGNNPTFLYSYGGFNVPRIPEFKVPDLVWMERGGIFAVANLRGGSEYGEEWHRAGMLEKKQNVFDDFIGAAEYLVAENYTSPKKLAIKGRSNGGLLTAACMLQRPDLYGAVISQVPVIDMLRYHKFTVGRFWIPEYGDAETKADHFRFMYPYSPLHNVRFGTVYPPVMIMTAKTDDRVVPAHSLKFAATMQTINLGNNPILLRVEFGAGHGAGKPTHLLINEQSDVYTFIDKMLNR